MEMTVGHSTTTSVRMAYGMTTTSIVGTSGSPTIVGVDSVKKSGRILTRERENTMNDFTIDELNSIHLSLITRERVIREQWIPNTTGASDIQSLMDEADALGRLQKKVCAAKLSKQFGFTVEPVYS